jgi:hypothetical protein
LPELTAKHGNLSDYKRFRWSVGFPNYSSGLVSDRIRNSGIDGDLIPVNGFGDDKGGNRRVSGTHRNASGTEG